MPIVYKITNQFNGKIYVGKTDGPLNERWSDHLSVATIKKVGYSYIHKAINKYGKEHFTIEILEEVKSSELCIEIEIYWIALLQTNESKYPDGIGYNLTDGGEGTSGFKKTPENIAKTSGENHYMFGKEIPENVKQKLSEALSGENNPFYGKRHPDEVLKNIKDKQKQWWSVEENKLKMKEALRGSKHYKAKFTDDDILEIRRMWNNKEYSQTKIAKIFNVKPNTINQIVNNKRWTHIK